LSTIHDGFSIYSQLPSISGGRLLHPQPEDAPCRGDRDSYDMVLEPEPVFKLKRQVMIIFQQKLSKQGLKHYGLSFMNLLMLDEIRKNCFSIDKKNISP